MTMGTKILLVVFSLVTLIVSPKLFVFMYVSMAPAIVSYLVDVVPGKNKSVTIALFNFAGFAVFAGDMLEESGSIRNISEALDIFMLFVVYLFAAVGSFIAWIVPKATIILFEHKDQSRIKHIEKSIEKLEEEWGEEIRN